MTSGQHGDDAAIRLSLLGLTAVTGVVDAVSFLGLGHIFTANMTGNAAFLGLALGGGAGVSVARSLPALSAFACGGICGGRINTRDRTPARSLLTAMCFETLLLLLAVASTVPAAFNASSVAYIVIVFTALAMGLRNAVVRKLGIPDMTTTVLTLTITGLAADSRLASGKGDRSGRRRRAARKIRSGRGARYGGTRGRGIIGVPVLDYGMSCCSRCGSSPSH